MRPALWIALVLASATPAYADRVAVPPVRLSGGGPAIADGLRASIAGGVAVGGHDPVGAGEVDPALARTPAIAACESDLCLAKLAELVHARAAIRTVVEVLGSSNYSFRLELVDAGRQRTIGRVEDTCPVCTSREATELLARSAASLMTQLKAPAPPPAASALVAAAPSSPPAKHYTGRGKLYLGLGIAGLVLGAGAIAGGATLLAIDGRIEGVTLDPPRDPVTNRFEGKIPGAVLIAGGSLLLIGGGLLIWRARLQRH